MPPFFNYNYKTKTRNSQEKFYDLLDLSPVSELDSEVDSLAESDAVVFL